MGTASKHGPKIKRILATPVQVRGGVPAIHRPDSSISTTGGLSSESDPAPAVAAELDTTASSSDESESSDRNRLKPSGGASWWKQLTLVIVPAGIIAVVSLLWSNASTLARLDERVKESDRRVEKTQSTLDGLSTTSAASAQRIQGVVDRLDKLDQKAQQSPSLTSTDVQLQIEKLRHELSTAITQDREAQERALHLIENRLTKLEKGP